MATAQHDALLWHIRKLAAGRGGTQRSDRQLLEDFSTCRDQAAFAALVVRHGPLVLRVCRRVLNHEQDAEDAFQATFLVLAQKAGSIRKREALAEWLHGVAFRTALAAKRKAARRRNHEARLGALLPQATPSPSWDGVRAILDDEIQRLPATFRTVFVLCVLEGKSGPEAAAELGIQPGTVSSRLSRARQRLQQRLARRGIELSALLGALAVAENAGRAAVPAVLASATLRFGLLAAAGGPAAGGIPAKVAALAAGVTRAMFLTKAKIATTILLTMSLLAGGTGILTHQVLAGKLAAPQETAIKAPSRSSNRLAAKQESAKPEASNQRAHDRITYSGRVLGPEGRPVAGAKLYLTRWWGYHFEPFRSPESATTGPDGRFAFTVSKAKYQDQATIVSAAAPNLGLGWVRMHKNDKRTDLRLQLVRDDVPVTGQILDLEGKPVPGATLRVLQIMASPKEDLGPWLEASKDKTAPVQNRSTGLEQRYLSHYTTAPSPVATTDGEGRFRLAGIGRNRLLIAQLDGPTIASEHLHILTRLGEPFKIPNLEADPNYGTPQFDVNYYGAVFRHVAGPTKPIVGVVRDKDTKKPLAGVTVQSEKLGQNPLHGRSIVKTVTDGQGRYRLVGLPRGAGNKIKVVPPVDLPYIAPVVDVPDSFGPDPVKVDVELKRAVWIEGKITDKITGKPLRGGLMYLARDKNPNRKDYLGFYGGLPGIGTNEDGSYRIIGLPGPGLLAVWRQPQYLLGAERDDEDGLKEAFGYIPQCNFAAFARIDPAKGVESVKRDIALVPGWTFSGTVLGPDGKPLIGAVMGGQSEKMKTAEFTVQEFNPRRPRPVFFRQPEKGLIGVAHPPKENGGTITVRMEPGAAVTGRLVEADGTPRAGVELRVSFSLKEEPLWNESSLPDSIKTDRDGRFRIDALVPGFDYYLNADHRGIRFVSGLRAGEIKDLGDVRIKP